MTDEQFRARAIAALEKRKRCNIECCGSCEAQNVHLDAAIEIIRALKVEPEAAKPKCEHQWTTQAVGFLTTEPQNAKAYRRCVNCGAWEQEPAPAAQGDKLMTFQELRAIPERIAALEKRQAETEATVRDLVLGGFLHYEKERRSEAGARLERLAAKIAGEGGR